MHLNNNIHFRPSLLTLYKKRPSGLNKTHWLCTLCLVMSKCSHLERKSYNRQLFQFSQHSKRTDTALLYIGTKIPSHMPCYTDDITHVAVAAFNRGLNSKQSKNIEWVNELHNNRSCHVLLSSICFVNLFRCCCCCCSVVQLVIHLLSLTIIHHSFTHCNLLN